MKTVRRPFAGLLILAILAGTLAATTASASVMLKFFDAKPEAPDTVHLAWRTYSEDGNAGFYLYRRTEQGEKPATVFVPSTAPGNGLGATYRYTDTVPGPGVYVYWIADVDKAGNFTHHDPVQVLVAGPTAVELSSLEASAAGFTCARSAITGKCWCKGAYGWRTALGIMCMVVGR